MPSPIRSLTTRDVRRYVDEQVFTSTTPGNGHVGVEVEWVTRSVDRSAERHTVTPDQLLAALGLSAPGDVLPDGARVTFEPGGQLELSGPAFVCADTAIAAMARDAAVARRAVSAHGIDLVGIGLDPAGLRDRVIDGARYAAMEQYFDTQWPDGRVMMRNTASVQVNVDLGAPSHVESRWQRAHAIVPVLAAAFANSPFDTSGSLTGSRSSRLDVWRRLDPRRTRAAARPGTSAATAWTTYALDAPVMMIDTSAGPASANSAKSFAPIPRPLSFARWIHDGHELGWPTIDDFEYHLSTLFPPVRPRGWFELRTIDALPDEWWPVAVAVTAALLDDDTAADIATRASAAVAGRAHLAARDSCHDPELRTAVDQCFVAAIAALPRIGAASARAATEAYYERYVAPGRCPADDLHHDPCRWSPSSDVSVT